ncbi:MAG: NapC/NirT family cytochrome c [Gammaproteobacteria bacterium]|nr:NapC/NirT family cytochrome c [Gammaproteobacteria bacterium]MDH3413682.1 NapC/NirT family cytochrome c [Gammaproteobacteria bacterium]
MAVAVALPLFAGIAAPAGAPPPQDWSQIPVKEMTLFYPRQSSYDWLYETDSATCRNCHREDAIRPEKTRGQRQHEQAREKRMTRIASHYNLVHAEVEPRDEFLERSEK